MTEYDAEIEWKDGHVPVSRRFADPFYSFDNGLEESRHVFLSGNRLPERFVPGFHIAELGFGTGLNLLATLLAWRQARPGGKLRFTSFEAYPLSVSEMETALAAFPETAEIAAPLIHAWRKGRTRFETEECSVTVILGDARQELPDWDGQADAWFLDGFAPARNPELWEADLMVELARHTRPGGTCATYTAAGQVRRGLDEAGFDVSRVPGFGRKRHMTIGTLRP
ncbi:MAG: tRNA (5-methylaminomethyl-2-thiouridine)(34)-methyltransferase MnmD [Qingshengfaniella sp.]